MLAVGALATALPPVAGLPLFGYAAIALLLVGTLMLMPRVAVLALSLLPRPRAPAARLALAQLRGAPGQVSVSLAAIVASVSLIVSMVIMVASFRDSLDAWLERVLPADLYFRAASGGDTAYLPRRRAGADRGAARRAPRRIPARAAAAARSGAAADRAAGARRRSCRSGAQRCRSSARRSSWRADAPPPVWVTEAAVDLYGFAPGNVIELPIAGKAERFTVAGVWRDYARQQGAIAIERAALHRADRRSHGDQRRAVARRRAPTGIAVEESIRREIPGGDRLEICAPGEIRSLSLQAFDRTFAVTYALELAAVVIGLVGLSSSFGALVLARRREFGVLRHLGMTRRQIGAMLATEGLAVSGIGLAVGLALGVRDQPRS